ncbi:MAG: hypothetical protein ACC682_07270 [Gemmatimonadota bacterium]
MIPDRRGHRLPGALVFGVSLACVSMPQPSTAQSPNPIVASTLEPDSIFVGEVFALDLWVELPAAGEVRFPAVLPLPEEIEQRGGVETESTDDGKSWRARYSLSAWSADSLAIPPVAANIIPEDGAEFPVMITAPIVVVASVLPVDEAGLELRDARPFLRVRSFPWWLLVLLAAAAAVAYWWWKRRRPEVVMAPSDAGHLALRDLERLRIDWNAGQLPVGRFYDRYERSLRRYARMTRRWAPTRSLLGLGVGGELIGALRRSAFVRFAHLRGREGGPESALEAGEAFVRSELPSEPEDRPTGGES